MKIALIAFGLLAFDPMGPLQTLAAVYEGADAEHFERVVEAARLVATPEHKKLLDELVAASNFLTQVLPQEARGKNEGRLVAAIVAYQQAFSQNPDVLVAGAKLRLDVTDWSPAEEQGIREALATWADAFPKAAAVSELSGDLARDALAALGHYKRCVELDRNRLGCARNHARRTRDYESEYCDGDAIAAKVEYFAPVVDAKTHEAPRAWQSEGETLYTPEKPAIGASSLVEVAFNDDAPFSSGSMTLDAEGAKAFEALTRRNIGKRVLIAVNGKAASAPRVMEAIPGGRTQVSGSVEFKSLCRETKRRRVPKELAL